MMEIPPKMPWKCVSFDKTYRVIRTMGKSVIIGARATLMPDFIPCCKVSEITRVNNGPGANPADKPSTVPMDIK